MGAARAELVGVATPHASDPHRRLRMARLQALDRGQLIARNLIGSRLHIDGHELTGIAPFDARLDHAFKHFVSAARKFLLGEALVGRSRALLNLRHDRAPRPLSRLP